MLGEFFQVHFADPFTSIRQKTGRNWARQRKKQRTRRANETKLDLLRENGRKLINKVLDEMIFPKVVQCSTIDLQLQRTCR